MAEQLKVRAELMFGRTASLQDRHEVVQPSASELRELFDHFARFGASQLTVERLDDPGEGRLEATRRVNDEFLPGPYQLDRTEQTGGNTYRALIDSPARAAEIATAWARTDTASGAEFADLEWELLPGE